MNYYHMLVSYHISIFILKSNKKGMMIIFFFNFVTHSNLFIHTSKADILNNIIRFNLYRIVDYSICIVCIAYMM